MSWCPFNSEVKGLNVFFPVFFVRLYIPVSLTCRETHLYIGKNRFSISKAVRLSVDAGQRHDNISQIMAKTTGSPDCHRQYGVIIMPSAQSADRAGSPLSSVISPPLLQSTIGIYPPVSVAESQIANWLIRNPKSAIGSPFRQQNHMRCYGRFWVLGKHT
jgi:hypothetical protein